MILQKIIWSRLKIKNVWYQWHLSCFIPYFLFAIAYDLKNVWYFGTMISYVLWYRSWYRGMSGWLAPGQLVSSWNLKVQVECSGLRVLLLIPQKTTNGSQVYIISALLWIYIPNWEIQWLIVATNSVLVSCLRYHMHLKKAQDRRFPQVGMSSDISSMQHAGPSSSTQNPRINSDCSDRQQPRDLLT